MVGQGICHQSQQFNQSVLPASLEKSVSLQLEAETHRTDDAPEFDPDSWTQSARFTTNGMVFLG